MIRREARSSFAAPRDAVVPASLHLLGKLRITGQRPASGQRLEERYHVQALLALIGPSFSGVPRDELIDALWPNHGQAAGRSRLYHTLHLARKAVASVCWDENWVSLRSGRVVLDERVWCDARVLTAAASQTYSTPLRKHWPLHVKASRAMRCLPLSTLSPFGFDVLQATLLHAAPDGSRAHSKTRKLEGSKQAMYQDMRRRNP